MNVKGCTLFFKQALAVYAATIVCCADAYSNESKWSQEWGFYTLSPDVSSSTVSGPGLPPSSAVNVENGDSFLLSTSYHQNENLSYEFFYSWWNELNVFADGSIAGLGEIGEIEYLAPTFMVNWTFGNPAWAVRPHIGLGINRMIYGNEQAATVLNGALGGETSIKVEDTWGIAATAGLTWSFSEQEYGSLAYVVIPSDTNVRLNTPSVGIERSVDLDIDLRILYLNLGSRF